MKAIHITDLHLVAPGEQLWEIDTAARVDACLEDISRWHSDAAFCVISGDLTDKGQPEAYAWLKKRLELFPLPTFLMLGNHDERDAFLATYPGHPCDLHGFIQQSHRTPHGVFLFLDTKKEGRVSQGELCGRRLAWLADELKNAGSAPVYIFMHHPPCDIGLPRMDRIKLEEPEAFAEVVTNGANVRHIFFGHVHRPAFVNWRGIPCSCLPGTNHQVPLVRDSVGTAYSHEPPGYGVIMIDDAQVAVHFDACLHRKPVNGT